jgi:RND family efflux transporter MFP subunit
MNDSSELLRELRIDRQAPTESKRSRTPLWSALIAALIAAGIGTWLITRDSPIEVRTAVVQAMPSGKAASAASVLDASGYVTARRQATVSSKITGKVIEVMIEEGMRVEEGQVLARLDPIDAEAQRQLSQSQLQASRAQLIEARTQLDLAEKTLARQSELLQRKLVAQSMFDQAKSERDALRARVATAQRNVQVSDDALALSDISIDNTIVRAPFAGVVTVKAAQPGEMISPVSAGGGFTRSGIATVVDMDSLEVQVDVNESFIGRVRPKQKVEAVLHAYPDWVIPAEVIAIVPTADRGKATVKVRIALKEKDPRIVPEMGVRVSFLEKPGAKAEDQPQGVRVPSAAIVERRGETVAFALGEDDTVERRMLKTGNALGDDRQVLSGLSPGETVVLDPPEALEDGGKVRMAAEADGG